MTRLLSRINSLWPNHGHHRQREQWPQRDVYLRHRGAAFHGDDYRLDELSEVGFEVGLWKSVGGSSLLELHLVAAQILVGQSFQP